LNARRGGGLADGSNDVQVIAAAGAGDGDDVVAGVENKIAGDGGGGVETGIDIDGGSGLEAEVSRLDVRRDFAGVAAGAIGVTDETDRKLLFCRRAGY